MDGETAVPMDASKDDLWVVRMAGSMAGWKVVQWVGLKVAQKDATWVDWKDPSMVENSVSY